MKPHSPVADDVASASAAYLANLLPAIMALPDSERYERLKVHFLASIQAYRHCAEQRRRSFPVDIQPSAN